MGTPITISFSTFEEKKQELDKIAESRHRDRSYILNEAIDQYLDLQNWKSERTAEAIASLNRGRFLTTEQVQDRLAKLHAETKKKSKK